MIRKDLFERTDPQRALELLKEGNKRYVKGELCVKDNISEDRKLLAEKGQVPFAVIIGCADSRVPPEFIFDVGIGQLFVLRTAGNIADDFVIGSAEYAVDFLHSRLIVVLGHSRCGAVTATIAGGERRHGIGAIMEEIAPSVEAVRKGGADEGTPNFLDKCEDENTKATAAKLAKSDVLQKFLADGTLKIVCAKYCLDTGKVNFFN